MMQLTCPCCGAREEREFVCGGASHIARPDGAATDAEWGEYLFFRANPRGVLLERWRHAYGCGLWFNVARDTLTHEIVAVYAISAPPPAGAHGGAA